MNGRFITAVRNLEIRGQFGRGFRLSRKLFLTNDATVIAELITGPLEITAGQLEIETIRRAPAVIYSIEAFDSHENRIEESKNRILANLRLIQTYLMGLWFVRDNAVNTELGFFEYPYRASAAQVSSHALVVQFSDAAGSLTTRVFDRGDLERARELLQNVFGVHEDAFETVQIDPTIPHQTDRIERAWYFAQAARCQSDVGLKLASYMTCLESLFTTDAQELSHKLSERAAVFLGERIDERKDIYRETKRAYNIRSKVVHGDRLRARDIEIVRDLSKTCDNYVRRALVKIFENSELVRIFGGENDALENYFVDTVLSASLQPRRLTQEVEP